MHAIRTGALPNDDTVGITGIMSDLLSLPTKIILHKDINSAHIILMFLFLWFVYNKVL